MKVSSKKKRILFALVATLGVLFIVGELYLLTPALRTVWVSVLEQAGASSSLAGMLEDQDWQVSAAAEDALVRRGAAAVPALAGDLARPNAAARAQAAEALGRIGPPAAGALPALEEHMRADPDQKVRSAATRAFGLVGRDDPAVLAKMAGLVEAGTETECVAAEGALASAVEALVQAGGEGGKRAVPYLIRGLKKHCRQARIEAADALEALGPVAREALPALIDTLEDPDPKVRSEVVEAIESIVGGLGDEDGDLRAQGKAALEKAKRLGAGQPP